MHAVQPSPLVIPVLDIPIRGMKMIDRVIGVIIPKPTRFLCRYNRIFTMLPKTRLTCSPHSSCVIPP